jgi:hypothetical protein
MSYVPIVLGIRPHTPRVVDHYIEVVYRSGDKLMRLECLDDRHGKYNSAKKELDMHGRHWIAWKWRHQNEEWSYL